MKTRTTFIEIELEYASESRKLLANSKLKQINLLERN